jgi:hypothetical protein
LPGRFFSFSFSRRCGLRFRFRLAPRRFFPSRCFCFSFSRRCSLCFHFRLTPHHLFQCRSLSFNNGRLLSLFLSSRRFCRCFGPHLSSEIPGKDDRLCRCL